jgi:hypothetical protein
VQRQIDDLECSETAILAQLEEQKGSLRPVSPIIPDQSRPAQVTSTLNIGKTTPDS